MSFFDKLFKRNDDADVRRELMAALTGEYLSNIVSQKDTMQINAVYACVNIISNAVAGLPFDLYRRTKGGRERATDHPLYRLTKNPSLDMTGYLFKESLIVNLLIYGNAFVEVVRTRGRIRELNLIPSNKVSITKNDATGEIVYYLNTGKVDNNGVYLPIDPKNLMPIVGKCFDGKKGKSPVELCMQSIAMARALETFGLRYFETGARPSGFLKTPRKLSEEAAARLKGSFAEKYQGTVNSGKVILLEDGMDYAVAQNGNDTSQFLESRRFQIEEIARIFQVPLFLLQSTEKSTSWGSGMEQLNISFVQHCLQPYLKRVEEAYNFYLLSEKEQNEYYFEFNVDGLLRGDQKSRYDAYHTAILDGWLSPNEVRTKENLPAIEGGDVYLMPVNMASYAGSDKKEVPDGQNAADDKSDGDIQQGS